LVIFGGFDLSDGNYYDMPIRTDSWVLTSAIRSSSVGLRNVIVQTGAETPALSNGFTISSSAATSSAMLAPVCGSYGYGFPVAITGDGTSFMQGVTQANFGAGISVGGGAKGEFGPITVISPTSAIAHISIDPAPITASVFNAVRLVTGSESVSVGNGFRIIPGSPTLLSVSPGSAAPGQAVIVTVTGQGTHFSQGPTQVSFGGGLNAGSPIVLSLTSLQVRLTVNSDATIGPRTVTVTTGKETAVLASGFTVVAAPAIATISPNAGQQGKSGPIAILGSNKKLVQGATKVSLRQAIN
jgi:hypothetical protein